MADETTMSLSNFERHEIILLTSPGLSEVSAAPDRSGRKKNLEPLATSGGLSDVDGDLSVLLHRISLPGLPLPIPG
jgi:hypothetical protein